MLIADIDPMSPEEAERRAEDYRKRIPELGKTRLKGGQVTPLTIREPLSNLVADGYVAIGDSAHMSMAVNGSGLSIGFEVSQFLAETIMADKKGEFTAKTLYPFAYKFWKKKGINMAPIAFVKLLIFKLTHEQLDYAFDKGILTWREMTITADQHSIFQFLHWDWGLPKRGVALFSNPALHLRPRRPPAEEVQPPEGHPLGETLRLALPAPPAEVKPPAPPAEAKLPAPPAEVNTSLTSNCSTSCGAVFSAKPHKLVFVERSRLAHSRFGRGCHSSSAHWKRNSNPFSRYQLFRLPFLGEIIWVSVKRQPLFPKTPIRVAFFLRYIFVSCQKSNLNSPKCILQLPFPGNA